ncbi:amidohydrolase [Nonomuraea sp. NPDC050310]|uniref:amidohydrolase n=1 Tax=Nonomuraea sp. NPDC050310 TaxID=3154935 RepID=UPI0033E397FA
MRRIAAASAVLALACLAVSAPAASAGTEIDPADTVFTGGTVYTAAKGGLARAVAVDDGKIVYVGDEKGAAAYVGEGTKLVRLDGRMVMPGILDGHIHLEPELFDCSLEYAELTAAQLLERLQKCLDADKGGDDDWLTVFHWDLQGMKPAGFTPTRRLLDKLKTKRPIYLFSTDGHNAWVNSRALKLAGITAKTKNPPNGVIVKDAKGRPTGYLKEEAGRLITKVIPKPAASRVRAGIKAMLSAAVKAGITGANSVILEPYQLPVWKELADAGEVPIKLDATVRIDAREFAKDPEAGVAKLAAQAEQFDGPNFRIGGVKIFLDGVIEYPAQTALLRKPYVGSKNRGTRFVSDRDLRKTVTALDAAGWQVHLHALGDGAVHQALNAVAYARRVNGPGKPHSLAHLQLVDPVDLKRFRPLGVIADLQLQWAQRDPYTVDAVRAHLGESRWKRQYPARSLWRAGALVAGGSDFPVDPLNPFRQIEAAITRTIDDPKAYPRYAKPLGPDQALTLEQSLRMHTLNTAIQLRMRGQTGSLEVGKQADLLLLDRDLFAVPATAISDARPLAVLVDGKTVAGGL